MEDITDIVVSLTNKRIKQLAEEIKAEIEAEISNGHVRSGKALNSFAIRYNSGGGGDFATGMSGSFRGGFLTSVSITSDEKSAYYLDQGNGPGRIYPTDSPYLKFRDTRPGSKGRLHRLPSVASYEGIHYIKEVADRHR